MDIVLALLRTLVFVVATVAATVYVGRRIGRGRTMLWTGTTVLALHWLVDFGWTTYRVGSPTGGADAAGWITWAGYLLPFLAALAYIWGIGQAAGFPARSGADAGAQLGRVPADQQPAEQPTRRQPADAKPAASEPVAKGRDAAPPSTAGMRGSGGSVAAPPTTSTPSQPTRAPRQKPAGLVVPHAVPVVMTPSSRSHQSPPDPDPVVDLGPDPEQPPATDPLGTAGQDGEGKPAS